ncbi:MAG: hypothetical protein B6241_13515 [Spirochaetaceae bacterium 4572_59]|nr:MAG: hypothetical protein B6241_13515 [Spirochaetaceae bacterium 4572_59]
MTGKRKELFNSLDRVYVDKSIQEALTFLNREDREQSPYLPSRFYGINHGILSPVTRGLINYEKLSRSDYYLYPDQSLDALNCLGLGFQFDLNKTRLLMAVVREATKKGEDTERCVYYLSLYRKVLEGSPAQIRSLLVQKFHLTILADRSLNSMDGGFDDRVYGSFSLGKRTALQVLVDAYIKGLSRVSIVHINEIHSQIISVVLEAGRMLGIDVDFSLEFSHGRGKGKQNFLLYFPQCKSSGDYEKVLESDALSSFQSELARVSTAREKAVSKEIRHFNRKVRPGLNKGFENYPDLIMEPVSLDELLKTIKINRLSIPSLGHYLFQKYEAILQQRTEAFDLEEFAPLMGRLKKMKNREISDLVEKVERLDQESHKMDHEEFTARYLSDDLDYSVTIPGFIDQLKKIRTLGVDVIIAYPLSGGLPTFLEKLLYFAGVVNGVELFNTKYFFNHRDKEQELAELVELVSIYNQGAVKPLLRKAKSYGLMKDRGDKFKILLADATLQMLNTGDEEFKIKLGSGSNDYSIASPGMGFLIPKISHLGFRSSLRGLAGHYALPFRLGENPEALPFKLERCGPFSILSRLSRSAVILLGNPTARTLLRNREQKISLLSRIRNSNPTVRNALLILFGVLFSQIPVKGTLAPRYIFLWFTISLLQSVLSDLISHGGRKLKHYHRALINGKDLSSYLFYTGMAIPVLGNISFRIEAFLELRSLSPGSSGFILFILLGLASWVYTGVTTLLRGYKPLTALVNGARSFYSFPLAALSAMFLPLPPIVQQKIWTAVAGAVVEGFAKYREDLTIRRRDYQELFREIHLPRITETRLRSLLYDLLYIRGRQPRGRDVF